jgi:hypothetical protein
MTERAIIIQAYRSLYRASLRAVQYAVPQRYIVRDRLRRAFRESCASSHFEPPRIQNTLRFLENAARDRGMEHRIVKTLCHVWWGQRQQWSERARRRRSAKGDVKAEVQAYDDFHWTLKMLNESMGLCIR